MSDRFRIYVASSWRNLMQQGVVHTLRAAGYEVYDFKNPEPGDDGFRWMEIDPAWESWDPETFRESLFHPIALRGFNRDMEALKRCDVCLLVNPCGRSAHLEAGWAIGAGKRVILLLADGDAPELMYLMAGMDGRLTDGRGHIATSLIEALEVLARWEGRIA
jgi:nucleoside 2-deoxyribosyltransferase